MNENHGLTAANFIRTLPDVLRNDESMLALASGLADVLAQRPAEIASIKIYQNIDVLPESLLDQMAHDFNVAWWNYDWTIEQKRDMFRESWHIRKHLGTKYAVELALQSSFGSGRVTEWFEYGGEPYHFRILDVDVNYIAANLRSFYKILEVVGRKSAVLDAIRTLSVRDATVYYGAVMRTGKKLYLDMEAVDAPAADYDIMGDENGNALADWDGGIIVIDKEATS